MSFGDSGSSEHKNSDDDQLLNEGEKNGTHLKGKDSNLNSKRLKDKKAKKETTQKFDSVRNLGYRTTHELEGAVHGGTTKHGGGERNIFGENVTPTP